MRRPFISFTCSWDPTYSTTDSHVPPSRHHILEHLPWEWSMETLVSSMKPPSSIILLRLCSVARLEPASIAHWCVNMIGLWSWLKTLPGSSSFRSVWHNNVIYADGLLVIALWALRIYLLISFYFWFAWVVGCWHGYLSGARCRLATATHCLLLQ